MADPRFAIVVTTIGRGEFLEVYAAKLAEEGLLERTTLIVIPDHKTPRELADAVASARRSGLAIEFPDFAAQEAYLARLGSIGDWIPANSDARRNIGFLMAYELASEVIVGIDDDNLCELPGPWLAEHGIAGAPAAAHAVTASASGWYNPCALIETSPAGIYPRGFPYAQRSDTPPSLARREVHGRIDVNAGLWLGAPDVDAFTHLAGGVEAHALLGSVVLDPNTWAPVNTQNTAIRREAMAAWWFVRMGDRINGLSVQRYGDILSGYFLVACARQAGGLVRFGTPAAMHRRNAHDHGTDALGELAGIWLTEDILPWLHELRLSGADYRECYRALADALDEFSGRRRGAFWTASALAFISATTSGMRDWAEAIRIIDGA